MRLPEHDSTDSLSASPDSAATLGPAGVSNGAGPSNGLKKGLATNGATALAGNGAAVAKRGKLVARVDLQGKPLYSGSYVDREEYIRLVVQSLRDAGYEESATTLESESGYAMETPDVSDFRQFVMEGSWTKAESVLTRLVGSGDEAGLWDARFLICQQKYLELLEAKKVSAALNVLRNEIRPMGLEPERLHLLSSYLMCEHPDDLRERAQWDGTLGTSRQRLLAEIHRFVPSSLMIPPQRIVSLLEQSRSWQQSRCLYHNSPAYSLGYSLYTDHQCDKDAFPSVNTLKLQAHSDEVWGVAWSHDGRYLASASKDQTAIIWMIGPQSDPNLRDVRPHHILRDHPFPVSCIAWSLDDSVLLTGSEAQIRLWNTRTGLCIRLLEEHSETVTSLEWLPDGSGFVSGGLDRQIIRWDAAGGKIDSWDEAAVRVTDLAVTPDCRRLVVVGLIGVPPLEPSRDGRTVSGSGGGNMTLEDLVDQHKMIVYDLITQEEEMTLSLEGDLSSVKISSDCQFALINHAPNEIHLYDLISGRLTRKFTGQQQGHHIIRSCFGGVDGNFVVSGSEDGKVYLWHRDTGALLEVLPGHGPGSVNAVAWNPTRERMFASCSDDCMVYVWEPPPPPRIEELSQEDVKGKGKTRQLWEGDGVASSSRIH
ncbi:WD40-repeat-containing domain protein [Schizophyllum amplum]|uniref:WD40-repeat-containing domain protein n=1 Tax=Schizophyllum amplum TaxID=97359 RepID=A0A550CCM2_9AGAR|nr:WD40-repeat-containing domain protein [Auriculariopsis ampla]